MCICGQVMSQYPNNMFSALRLVRMSEIRVIINPHCAQVTRYANVNSYV